MENINRFNIKRTFQIIYRQLIMSIKPWTIGIAAAGGFLLGVFVLQVIASGGYFNLGLFTSLGFVILFVGGYIFTSNIFNELQSPVKSQYYLTLPARTEEKLIAGWLMSSVFFAIVSLVLIFLISFIISGVLNLLFEGSLQLFNPLSERAMTITGVYLVTQTIFLLGSVYFRKFNFLKTLLSVFVVYIILFIWIMIMVFAIIKPQDMVFIGPADIELSLASPETISTIMSVLFWYVIGPFFLIVSYLRLKERQV